ncbi:MAG: type II secretion system F family protein [bacterium]|nr:type II secretion system F family protein [bacterium]
MDSFSYVAIAKDGKEKKGSIEAASQDHALSQLKADGLIPLTVTAQTFLTKDLSISFGTKVKPRDYSLFCRQTLGIIAAGVNIIDALEIVGEQTENKYLKRAIKATQSGVEKGDGLAASMQTQQDIFPQILINMVEAGEASGSLEIAFDRMASHFEKEAKLKAMIKKAMIYPSVVGIVAIGVIIVMMVAVVPNFESLFGQMGTELPWITRMVRNASQFITSNILLLAALIAAIIAGIKAYKKTPTGEEMFAKLALTIPVFGKLNMKSYCSRYARNISTLLSAGIPLMEAIEITAKTVDNKIIQNVLLKAKEEVARGVPLSIPLKASGIFPAMVCHMTKIGEETGNMEAMLERLADYYDEEVDIGTQSLSAVLEPFIILFLAVIVCILIASIMTPMLQMYNDLDSL